MFIFFKVIFPAFLPHCEPRKISFMNSSVKRWAGYKDELEIFRNERQEFKARAEGPVGVGRGGITIDRGKELYDAMLKIYKLDTLIMVL